MLADVSRASTVVAVHVDGSRGEGATASPATADRGAHTRTHAHTHTRRGPRLSPFFQIKYVEGGERAVSNFEAGASGFETRAFRGLGVFTSTPVQTPRPQTRARTSARVRLHRSRSSFFCCHRARSTRCPTIRIRCKCCSAAPRSANFTACLRRRCGRRQLWRCHPTIW